VRPDFCIFGAVVKSQDVSRMVLMLRDQLLEYRNL